MSYHPNPDDRRLDVEFYAEDGREFVRIESRDEDLVRVFRALDVSHVDEDGEDVTYMARFAPQYAAFKSGKTKSANDKIEDLQRQIDEAKAEKAGAEVDPKQADKIADEAARKREKAQKEAADEPQADGTVKVVKAK